MDDLAERLDETVTQVAKEPNFLMYADDVMLCLNGYQLQKTQEMLDTCQEWGNDAGLTFGIKKCGTQGIKNEDMLYLNKQQLLEASFYKYLGFDMTKDGIDWKRTWTRALDSTEQFLNFLFAIRTKVLSERHKATIIKTYVESKLRYPLGLWWMDPRKTVEERDE